MPQHNIFTRARRIFQNAAQPAQSQNPNPNPTDSANHSQYETDGSSYEMLVVASPSKSQRESRRQQNLHPQHDTQPTADEPPPTPRRRQSTRRKPDPQTPNLDTPIPQRRSDSEKTQTEPRTPPPAIPEEPQTPSQKLPTALRRIDATPIDLGKSGYNLRSRTRSQAPPTPQRQTTPARSRPPPRQKTPARSRPRDLRQAPSARTTSGVAARSAIVSRRQIDESSVITLRAMCRNFGLPTSGNKTELRARAIKEFETRDVLDEQNQPLGNEVKQSDDSIVPRASGDERKDSKMLNVENEENSAQVQLVKGNQQESHGEREEKDTGKELTTSTVKPAGVPKRLMVEAGIAAKSDEPSVHAKSDAPEKDPRQPLHPAECSIANSPARPIARRLEEFAHPTVSSTGLAASSPVSPRPPPPHPTPRIPDPSVPFTNKNGQQAPSESVDARGGNVDVAAIFQDLAAGRRKLSQAEYETVLRSLRDKAPDRPPPLQVPINAAHVSLSTLPSTPFQAFELPTAKAPREDKGAPLPPKASIAPKDHVAGSSNKPRYSDAPKPKTPFQLSELPTARVVLEGKDTSMPQKTSVVPQVHVAGSSNKPHYTDTPKPKPPVADALEKSDDNKRTIQQDASTKPPSGDMEDVENDVPEPMVIEKSTVTDTADDNGDERLDVHSIQNIVERDGEIKQVLQAKGKVLQGASRVKPLGNEKSRNLDSTTNAQAMLNLTNQTPLPTIFAGAEGGPREGNIVDTRERQHALNAEEAAHVNGRRNEDLSRELEAFKNTPRPQTVKRSGFATPRELVRRFNRFGEGQSAVEDDVPLKPEDNRDPATSLLRRNARRSSSGVPLFYSARGPSTTGRSILKTRTAFKARESQNRLRRIDPLHDLSGRPSFRVKRPLSASAGALLVDLRRINGAHRSSSERADQRGSYQAEMARRPPPMAASALKILKELEQIQKSNCNQTSRKRNVSPPPLPPSVVKRARRSGQFMKAGSSSVRRLSIFDQDGTETHRKDQGGSFSASKPNELMTPAGRLTPKIPIVAYGAGQKRSKRSRTAVDSEPIPPPDRHGKDDIVKKSLLLRTGDRGGGLSPPRTMKRILPTKESLTFGADTGGIGAQSMEASPQDSTLLALSKTNGEPERHNTSLPVFGGTFGGKRSLEASQSPSREQPTSKGPASAVYKMNAEDFKRTKSGETVRGNHAQNENAIEPVQTLLGKSEFNQPLSGKPPFLLPVGSAEQHTEQSKGFARPPGIDIPIEKCEEETKPAQAKGSKAISWPSPSAALTRNDSATLQSKENLETPSKEMDRPNGPSQEKPASTSLKQAQTTHRIGKNGVQVSAFPTYASPKDSLFGASASAGASSKKPPSTEGKNQDVKSESPGRNESSILHGSASPFGSFGGTKGAAVVVSAPSKPSDQGGGFGQAALGVSPFAKPTQETESQEKQQPLLYEKDDVGGGEQETLKAQSIPLATTAALSAGDFEASKSVQDSLNKTATDAGNLSKSTSDVAASLSVNPALGMPQHNDVGLSTGHAALLHTDPSADSKPGVIPLPGSELPVSTTPPLSVAPKKEKPDIPSSENKNDIPGVAGNKPSSSFGSGPFSVPIKDPKLQPTFSFSSAPQAADGAQSGPFVESKFSSALSSANSSGMFAFGSSAEKGSTVKPAPSFSGLSDSAALDKDKQNPFTQTTNPTPFSFGAQPSSGSGQMTKSSGPTFGLSSGSEAGTAFGQPNVNTTPAFGTSFGSASPLFNIPGGNNFGAGSTAPAFGAPTNSTTAPLFGNVDIPSTPFGTSSGPGITPTLGATNTGPSASTPAFGGASAGSFGGASTGSFGGAGADAFGGAGAGAFGGASTGSFGGASASAFSFGNANSSSFGANNPQQPNLFSQSGNPAPSGDASGAGGFNIGSATRGPPVQRRRLRGRRTLR